MRSLDYPTNAEQSNVARGTKLLKVADHLLAAASIMESLGYYQLLPIR